MADALADFADVLRLEEELNLDWVTVSTVPDPTETPTPGEPAPVITGTLEGGGEVTIGRRRASSVATSALFPADRVLVSKVGSYVVLDRVVPINVRPAASVPPIYVEPPPPPPPTPGEPPPPTPPPEPPGTPPPTQPPDTFSPAPVLPTTPWAPSVSVSGLATTTTSITVTWRASRLGTPVVRWQSSPDGVSWTDIPGGAAIRTFVFTSLRPGERYRLGIRGVSAANNAGVPGFADARTRLRDRPTTTAGPAPEFVSLTVTPDNLRGIMSVTARYATEVPFRVEDRLTGLPVISRAPPPVNWIPFDTFNNITQVGSLSFPIQSYFYTGVGEKRVIVQLRNLFGTAVRTHSVTLNRIPALWDRGVLRYDAATRRAWVSISYFGATSIEYQVGLWESASNFAVLASGTHPVVVPELGAGRGGLFPPSDFVLDPREVYSGLQEFAGTLGYLVVPNIHIPSRSGNVTRPTEWYISSRGINSAGSTEFTRNNFSFEARP